MWEVMVRHSNPHFLRPCLLCLEKPGLLRAAVRGLVRRVREGTGALAGKALDAGKVVVFWVAVFAAVKFVLESS